MRLLQYLQEEYLDSTLIKTVSKDVRSMNYNAEIYKNPTKDDLKTLRKELIKVFDSSEIRVLIEPKSNDTYIFGACLLHDIALPIVEKNYPMHTAFKRKWGNIEPTGNLDTYGG